MTVYTTKTSAFRSTVPMYRLAAPEKNPAPYSRLVVKSLAQTMELPTEQVDDLLEDYLTAESGEGLPPLPELLARDFSPLSALQSAITPESEMEILSLFSQEDLEELDRVSGSKDTEASTAPEPAAARPEPADDKPASAEPAAGAMAAEEPAAAAPTAGEPESDKLTAGEPAGGEPIIPEPAAESQPVEADLFETADLQEEPAAATAEAMEEPMAEKEKNPEAADIIELDAEVEEIDACVVEIDEEDAGAVPAVTDPWPWETSPDMTLEEALGALSDKELACLTEEIVKNTIEEKLPEGAIKSLCRQYSLEYQKVYSAIQRESKRRISRMNTKARTAPQEPDATMELGMRMAKKFLMQEMRGKRAVFKSPWPNEDGNYYIFQSHKVDDEELPTDFPTERVYYREIGDGWAISVGY